MTDPTFTAKVIDTFLGSQAAVFEARKVMGKQPRNFLAAFLAVATNEEKSLSEIADILGARQTSTSRRLLHLGLRKANLEPGLGLIDQRRQPDSRRTNSYRLTPDGRAFLTKLTECLSRQGGGLS